MWEKATPPAARDWNLVPTDGVSGAFDSLERRSGDYAQLNSKLWHHETIENNQRAIWAYDDDDDDDTPLMTRIKDHDDDDTPLMTRIKDQKTTYATRDKWEDVCHK